MSQSLGLFCKQTKKGRSPLLLYRATLTKPYRVKKQDLGFSLLWALSKGQATSSRDFLQSPSTLWLPTQRVPPILS